VTIISTIVIGSTNVKKRSEIKSIISDLSIKVLTLNDFNNVPEVEEDGQTFKDNAIKKAVSLAGWCRNLVIADDSGLEVEALNNQPGVYSARYAGPDATDEMRINKLLAEMNLVPEEKRAARFKCAIAVADSQKLHFVVEAECYGTITFKPEGANGFGYDPIFYLPEYKNTFAELDASKKNKISHRAKALALFREEFTRKFS